MPAGICSRAPKKINRFFCVHLSKNMRQSGHGVQKGLVKQQLLHQVLLELRFLNRLLVLNPRKRKVNRRMGSDFSDPIV